MFPSSTSYVLQVDGDSMISAYISDGDYLVMGDIEGDKSIKAGEIVTVKAEGYGTMVKRIDYNASKTILTGFNPEEEKITIASNKVEIEGVLLAVFRLNQ